MQPQKLNDDRNDDKQLTQFSFIKDSDRSDCERNRHPRELRHTVNGKAERNGVPVPGGHGRTVAGGDGHARHCGSWSLLVRIAHKVSCRMCARISSRMARASPCSSPGRWTEALCVPAVYSVRVADRKSTCLNYRN